MKPTSILPLPIDESMLVEGLRAGDVAAYRSLYVHFADQVSGLVRQLLPDAMVDDAMQETFLRGYRHIDRLRGDARLATWIHRIAVNVCLTALRRQTVRRRAEETSVALPPELPDSE